MHCSGTLSSSLSSSSSSSLSSLSSISSLSPYQQEKETGAMAVDAKSSSGAGGDGACCASVDIDIDAGTGTDAGIGASAATNRANLVAIAKIHANAIDQYERSGESSPTNSSLNKCYRTFVTVLEKLRTHVDLVYDEAGSEEEAVGATEDCPPSTNPHDEFGTLVRVQQQHQQRMASSTSSLASLSLSSSSSSSSLLSLSSSTSSSSISSLCRTKHSTGIPNDTFFVRPKKHIVGTHMKEINHQDYNKNDNNNDRVDDDDLYKESYIFTGAARLANDIPIDVESMTAVTLYNLALVSHVQCCKFIPKTSKTNNCIPNPNISRSAMIQRTLKLYEQTLQILHVCTDVYPDCIAFQLIYASIYTNMAQIHCGYYSNYQLGLDCINELENIIAWMIQEEYDTWNIIPQDDMNFFTMILVLNRQHNSNTMMIPVIAPAA